MRSKAQRPKPGVSGADTVGSPRAQRLSTTLLAVTGMSPAVLTETVWALATENPPVIPDRVVVVTTIAGRQAIERELLTAPTAEGPALWQELRLAILGADGAKEERLILEPPRLVEAPNPRTGRTDWLEDLRTPAENNATANFVLNELRRWTETPDTRLVVSIAGGRKTMEPSSTPASRCWDAKATASPTFWSTIRSTIRASNRSSIFPGRGGRSWRAPMGGSGGPSRPGLSWRTFPLCRFGTCSSGTWSASPRPSWSWWGGAA